MINVIYVYISRYADMSSEDQKTADTDPDPQGLSREKVCKVCGDKALGYNFNAITCESCKAFFRRNALKNKVLKNVLTLTSSRCWQKGSWQQSNAGTMRKVG